MRKIPVYNIGAVTRLTGIPVTTLHAWERRYGFPQLERTEAGHRLYSENDITLLRHVKERVTAGMKASLAITMVRDQADQEPDADISPALPVSPALDSLRQLLLEAFSDNNLQLANHLLGESLAFHSPETLTLEVIAPVWDQIGTGWQAGRISVATEHLASEYLRQRLLLWMSAGPAPRRTAPIILACAPGEWHDGSLLMLAVLLNHHGLPFLYLGQNVPFKDLAIFVGQNRPRVLVLTAMQTDTARNLAEWTRWISREQELPIVAFGGRAFVQEPELVGQTPGLYLGDTIQEGYNRLVQIIP